MKIRKLVLFSSNLGLNFSGGSNATVYLFESLLKEFEHIHLVAKAFGPWPTFFPFIKHTWTHESDAIHIIRELDEAGVIFYGDFRDSQVLVQAGVPFFFTYHDNWPEQKFLNVRSFIQSFRIKAAYQEIFKTAQHVFSVSDQKRAYIAKFTDRHSLVRNGTCMPLSKTKNFSGSTSRSPFKILMVGNVGSRKYIYALSLFKRIAKGKLENIHIDVYGNISRKSFPGMLERYPFVTYKGFLENLDYSAYHLLLSTSFIENLPISMLEALLHQVPVLSFDVGGISEIVRHEENGLLIAPYKIDLMYESLQKIIRNEYTFHFESDRYADFDWEKSGQLMLKQFRRFLNS